MTTRTTEESLSSLHDYDTEEVEKYMRMALDVGKAALEIGEVPVGCVIVLRQALDKKDDGTSSSSSSCSCSSVVISHGANQVNCTRDATRHAELVAVDRMLTRGQSSDMLRLPSNVIARAAARGTVPRDSALLLSEERRELLFQDKWVNCPNDPTHWKNAYGWGTGRIFSEDIFPKCDLYVTCEPCIMVGLSRVSVPIQTPNRCMLPCI